MSVHHLGGTDGHLTGTAATTMEQFLCADYVFDYLVPTDTDSGACTDSHSISKIEGSSCNSGESDLEPEGKNNIESSDNISLHSVDEQYDKL